VARRARLTEPPPQLEWVTVAKGARRLGMSQAWFGALGRSEGIHVVRRGSRPGVDWTTGETYIASSRGQLVDESLRPRHPSARAGWARSRAGRLPVRLVRPPARLCPRREAAGAVPLSA
jgi:hypothetical protein